MLGFSRKNMGHTPCAALFLCLCLLIFCASQTSAQPITDVKIVGISGMTADAPQAGEFYPLIITLSENPDRVQQEKISVHSIDIHPQIKITLMDLDRANKISANGDPVVSRFLGLPVKEHEDVTWPSEFTLGAIGENTSNPKQWIWTPLQFRQMGFTPPSAGNFILRATMRLNENTKPSYFDQEFRVAGKRAIGEGLFGLVGSTVRIIGSQLQHEKALAEEKAIRFESDSHRIEPAIEMMGKTMGRIFADSKVHSLGRYAGALTLSAASDEGIAQFLQPFLSGYGKYGLVIIPREGVKTWRAVSSRGRPYTLAPNTLRAPLTKGRLFVGKKAIVIPYSIGETISITLTGAGTKPVTVWEILPNKTNRTSYPIGKWKQQFVIQPGKSAFSK